MFRAVRPARLPMLSAPEVHPLPPIRHRTVRRRKRHGAWKVAYADFVTALMALFIVLWMMSSTDRVKSAISGYFRDPKGYSKHLGGGPAGAGEGMALAPSQVADLQKQIESALHKMPEFDRLRQN